MSWLTICQEFLFSNSRIEAVPWFLLLVIYQLQEWFRGFFKETWHKNCMWQKVLNRGVLIHLESKKSCCAKLDVTVEYWEEGGNRIEARVYLLSRRQKLVSVSRFVVNFLNTWIKSHFVASFRSVFQLSGIGFHEGLQDLQIFGETFGLLSLSVVAGYVRGLSHTCPVYQSLFCRWFGVFFANAKYSH